MQERYHEHCAIHEAKWDFKFSGKKIIANLLLQLVWEFLEETALLDCICDDAFLLEGAQIETQMCADERCGY